jgi:hypothetical protein
MFRFTGRTGGVCSAIGRPYPTSGHHGYQATECGCFCSARCLPDRQQSSKSQGNVIRYGNEYRVSDIVSSVLLASLVNGPITPPTLSQLYCTALSRKMRQRGMTGVAHARRSPRTQAMRLALRGPRCRQRPSTSRSPSTTRAAQTAAPQMKAWVGLRRMASRSRPTLIEPQSALLPGDA